MSPPDRAPSLPGTHPARAGFAILAAAEPGILPRLIAAFAQRSLVPARWHGSLTPAGEIELDIRFDGLDATQVERIAAKLRSLVGVRAVLTWRDRDAYILSTGGMVAWAEARSPRRANQAASAGAASSTRRPSGVKLT